MNNKVVSGRRKCENESENGSGLRLTFLLTNSGDSIPSNKRGQIYFLIPKGAVQANLLK